MPRNQTLDFLKFIFSICIIAIHTSVFKYFNSTLYYTIPMGLMRMAVPFFFVTSGYFYFQRLDEHKDSKSYILRLVKIFIIFEGLEVLIYTPALLLSQNFHLFPYLWKMISVGLGGIYWYLISLILSFVIVTPLWKKKRIYPTLIIGFILYLMVFSVDSYSMIFDRTWIQSIAKIHTNIWTWPQAGLCSSLFYLSLGALIYQKKPKMTYSKSLLIFSMICLVVESYLLQSHGASDANCYISLIIGTPLLFIEVLKHPNMKINTHHLGKMSLYIYMVHPIVLNVFSLFVPQGLPLFLTGSLVSIMISYLTCQKTSK